MSLQAHTNSVGSFDQFNTGYDRSTGNAYGQERNDYRVYGGMTLAHSFKTGTNSGIRPGDPWKYPTKYERRIAKILSDSTVTIVDNDGRTHAITYERSGQHLSIPFWPNEPSDIGRILNNAEDKSVNEALMALRGERKNPDGSSERVRMQLAADVAEARKTADMLADTMKAGLGVVRNLRRGNLIGAFQELKIDPRDIPRLKTPANAWLALQYGWKPLVGTAYDLHSRLGESLRSKMHMFSAQNTSGDSFQEKRIYPHILDSHHEAIYTYQCRVKTVFNYTIKSSVVDSLDSYGLLNPLSVAWELVPLSFVVDWFAPIGNTLAALSATAGLEFHSGHQSVVEKRSLTSHVVKNENGSKDISVVSGGSYHWESFRFNRQPFESFPLPRLYTNKNPFSTSHVTSALALLRQLL